MAINIDNNKLSLFHGFSKTPVSANITLGNAINKAGHTVSSTEVWADDIPYFGTMASRTGAHGLLSKDAKYGDMCKFPEDNKTKYFQRNQTAWTENASFDVLWTDVTDDFKDGFKFINSKGKAVIIYHENKFITNLDGDNNANTDSENCAARLWVSVDKKGEALPTGQTRLVEQFVGPTDKALNGLASVDYAPVVKKVGVSKPYEDGNQYSMLCATGTILWNTDTANNGTQYTISCFEYIGDKVSDSFTKLSDELGKVQVAAGAGISVSTDATNKTDGIKDIQIKGSGSVSVTKTTPNSGEAVITVGFDASNLATKQDVSDSKVTIAPDATTGKTGISLTTAADSPNSYTIGIDQTVIATKKSVDDLSDVVDGISGKLSSLESLPKFKVQVVSALPETLTDDMENTIFLIEDTSAPGTYVEHLVFKSGESLVSEKIGTTATDLTGYVKTIKLNGNSITVSGNEANLGNNIVTQVTSYGGSNGPMYIGDGSNGASGTLYYALASDSVAGFTKIKDISSDFGSDANKALTDTAATVATVADAYAALSQTISGVSGNLANYVPTSTFNETVAGLVTTATFNETVGGKVDKTDATYVKTVKVNGSELTTSGNVADIGTVIVGVDNTEVEGKGIQLAVTNDNKVKLQVQAASSTVPGLTKITQTITDGLTDTVVSSDAIFDRFKTTDEEIAKKANADSVVSSINGHYGQITVTAGNSIYNNVIESANCEDSTKGNLWGLRVEENYNGKINIVDGFISESGVIPGSTYGMAACLPEAAVRVEGNFIYNSSGNVIDTIRPERIVSGIFFGSAEQLESWVADVPNLVSAFAGFYNTYSLTTFIGDLSSFQGFMGYGMFQGCMNLETFIGDLSSLESGDCMFRGTNLSIDSLDIIADTIPVSEGYDMMTGEGVLGISWSQWDGYGETAPTPSITGKEQEAVNILSKIADKGWYLITNQELLPLFDTDKYETGYGAVYPKTQTLDLDPEPVEPEIVYYVKKK